MNISPNFINVLIAVITFIVPSWQLLHNKKRKGIKRITWYGWVSLLISFATIGNYFWNDSIESKEKRYSKHSGILYPKNADDRKLYLITGGDSMEYARGVIDFRKDLMTDDDIEFIAWVENNRLYVNTIIRDTLGNVVAELDRNEWIVNKNVTLDRNFDNSGLEVRDNQGSIVFQIELNGNLIKMKGVFELKNNRTFIISSTVYEQRNVGLWQLGPRKDVHRSAKSMGMLDIKPIFKYPSDLHKGERIR